MTPDDFPATSPAEISDGQGAVLWLMGGAFVGLLVIIGAAARWMGVAR